MCSRHPGIPTRGRQALAAFDLAGAYEVDLLMIDKVEELACSRAISLRAICIDDRVREMWRALLRESRRRK